MPTEVVRKVVKTGCELSFLEGQGRGGACNLPRPPKFPSWDQAPKDSGPLSPANLRGPQRRPPSPLLPRCHSYRDPCNRVTPLPSGGARRSRRFNSTKPSGPGFFSALARWTLKRAGARAPSPYCTSLNNGGEGRGEAVPAIFPAHQNSRRGIKRPAALKTRPALHPVRRPVRHSCLSDGGSLGETGRRRSNALPHPLPSASGATCL